MKYSVFGKSPAIVVLVCVLWDPKEIEDGMEDVGGRGDVRATGCLFETGGCRLEDAVGLEEVEVPLLVCPRGVVLFDFEVFFRVVEVGTAELLVLGGTVTFVWGVGVPVELVIETFVFTRTLGFFRDFGCGVPAAGVGIGGLGRVFFPLFFGEGGVLGAVILEGMFVLTCILGCGGLFAKAFRFSLPLLDRALI